MASPTSSKGAPMIIRPAKLSEYKILGRIASITYFPTAFTAFLSPNRLQYYSHYERGFQKRALTLMLDPRVRSMVACEATKPDVPIGYIHFKRLGDDQEAKRIIREKASVQLWILRWLVWAWYLLLSVILGDKASDPKALKVFFEWVTEDDEIYWKSHKARHNQWHVQSFVVLPMFQGRGVGKRLMAEVTKRAVEENVVIGLEASPEGEFFVSQLCSGGERFLCCVVMSTPGTFSQGHGERPLCCASTSHNRTAANLLNSIEVLGLIY
jgi:ribosomal protein S18 acetylase RimI-like enzyme